MIMVLVYGASSRLQMVLLDAFVAERPQTSHSTVLQPVPVPQLAHFPALDARDVLTTSSVAQA